METLIGIVPDDWAECRLEEVCDILVGPSASQVSSVTEHGSTDVPVVTPRDLRHNRVAGDCATGVPHEVARELSRYRLLPDDIVCSRTGRPGRHALVNASQHGWLVGPACIRLRVHQTISARYLVYYLGHPVVRDWIIRNAGGSVIPTLSTKMLGSLPVVVPTMAAQACTADVLSVLDDKIIVHEQISRATLTLRDAVLRRLLAGASPVEPLED